MAVYTELTIQDVQALTAPFGIGRVVCARGIAEGIENTNYFVVTDDSEYVLTVAESQGSWDIAFIAQLTTQLRERGLPVPAPLVSADGAMVLHVQNKPGLLVPRLPGTHPLQPTLAQCAEIGRALGIFHCVTSASDLRHTSCRSLDWIATTAEQIVDQVSSVDRRLLLQEIANLEQFRCNHSALPQAVIHGDLFRDNALFEADRLTGIIDFFSAGTGFLMFDVAVAVNDWCIATTAKPDHAKIAALLRGYSSERVPVQEEQDQWPGFLRIAALRFWVSRMAEALASQSGKRRAALLTIKDPRPYRSLLLMHIASHFPWPL